MYVASSFYVRKEWIYPGTWFWRSASWAVSAGKTKEGRSMKVISGGKRGSRGGRFRPV